MDNTCHKVEFQLDLCGSKILYQDLLRHLSMAFQGGNDEANLLVEFYSRAQKVKESEEAFADKLQILTCKVIIKKPDFWVNLNSTLKQCYASQLYDCNSTSIAKTLLVQMKQCSFTEFRNELARVLGTHQRVISKASTKIISTKSIEVKSGEEEEAPPQQTKSQIKKDRKISAQSSQIKDLQSKLDQAVAENSQIQELLSPATLTTAFTNALMLPKLVLSTSPTILTLSNLVKANLFWESAVHPSLWQGRMVSLIQSNLASIVKIWAILSGIASSFKLGSSSLKLRKSSRRV